MNITKLSLRNFRSFKQTQTIEFAPITLLFGPNSVGKSSVVMALFYLQQIIDKGQCNPQRLEALGNKYVGGFNSLVNGKDLAKSITIRVDVDKPETTSGHTFDDSQLFVDAINEENEHNADSASKLLAISSPVEWANKIAIELEIKWSASKKTAFICRQAVWLDDEFIAESVNSECSPNAIVHQVNYQHPLLRTDTESDVLLHDEFHQQVLAAATSVADDIEMLRLPSDQQNQQHAFFQYKSRNGVLPMQNKVLETSLEAEIAVNTRRIEEVFSDIFVATLDNLSDLLSDSLAIGPLRQIPDSTFDAEEHIKQGDWYSGRASWDRVFNSHPQYLDKLNYWLAGRHGLNLGYALVEKSEQGRVEYVSEPSLFSDSALPDISDFKGDLAQARYVSHAEFERENITLWDLHNDIEVTAADIGAGVSQVFPLVVAATSDIKGLICCEQPELHIHPQAQVAIGDMLTQTDLYNRYLIETHSEHLVLRLLRRIRETHAGELVQVKDAVLPSDISIMYLEASDDGVIATRTLITEDGDLAEMWPNGFFDERDEELF